MKACDEKHKKNNNSYTEYCRYMSWPNTVCRVFHCSCPLIYIIANAHMKYIYIYLCGFFFFLQKIAKYIVI